MQPPVPDTPPPREGAAEVVFTTAPEMTPEQAAVVDLHSILNIANVLAELLYLMRKESGPCEALAGELWEFADKIRLRAGKPPEELPDFNLTHRIRLEIKKTSQDSQQDYPRIAEAVLDVLEMRLAEMQRRMALPGRWEWMQVSFLRASMHQVLAAMEQNARGRYRIVRNIAEMGPGDYQVILEISSHWGEWIPLPAVVQDVLRDLVANARKYSPQGATINAGLAGLTDGLHLIVEDTGMGIPPSELPKVADFGYRASNALSKPTLGGGFGLTKARLVAAQYGGQLAIRSELNRGTRVSFWIPLPPQLPNPPAHHQQPTKK